MKIPFFNKQKIIKKWYLGLFLKEQGGIGIAMSWENGQMRIAEKEKFNYSDGWENLTQDIDELLLRLEQKLQNQFSDTIFFVYSHFVDEKANDIKKPYLQKIKEMVKSLELHALGYIECYEAVVGYLENKEETPLTAIVAELDKTQVSVFVYKGGHIVHKKIVNRTHSLVDDLTNSFEVLKGKVFLPARIILYNSKDLNDESTNILTHRWSEEYFVQIPRVEVVKEEEVEDGLVKIFQNQINERDVVVGESESMTAPKEIMGFVVGGDVPDVTAVQSPKKYSIKINLDFLKTIKEKFVFKKPLFKMSGKIPVIVGTIIILSALLINELFLHKAQLKLLLSSQAINKTLSIEIPVHIATSSADFSESKATTGNKEIGEPAKGSVIVHNFSDQEKIFTKGTVITSNRIVFSLDTDVKVASSSLAIDGSAKLPGKNSVKVTAKAIGPESNMDKGKRFTIADLPVNTYFAIADTAMTGGTKKTVRTVAKKDIEDLKALILTKAQKDQSNPTIKQSSDRIISQLSEIDLRDLNFSKEVGEEADSISLKTKAENTYYLYDKNQMLNELTDSIKSEVQNGYSINKNNINYQISEAKAIDALAKLKITLTAKAIKDINSSELIKTVKGKNRKNIETLLKNNFQVQGYELVVSEPLPFLKDYLPFIGKNIVLTVSGF